MEFIDKSDPTRSGKMSLSSFILPKSIICSISIMSSRNILSIFSLCQRRRNLGLDFNRGSGNPPYSKRVSNSSLLNLLSNGSSLKISIVLNLLRTSAREMRSQIILRLSK